MNRIRVGKTVFIAFLFYLFTFTYADNYQYSLKMLFESKCTSLIPSDYEGDGVDEILECHKYFVLVLDQHGFISKQFTAHPNHWIIPLGFFRLSDTINPSLFVSDKSCDTVFIMSTYDDKKCVAFVGKDINRAGFEGYDGEIISATSADLNNDGFNEIVCIVGAGFDLYPRGIFVYDYKNNKELWHYWIGGVPLWNNNLFCVDINGDGKKEIFFGTARTSNGAVANGVDDFHPWVIALNCEGKLLWKKQMFQDVMYAIIYVGDIYKNNKWKVIVCESDCFPESDYTNQIMILNAENGELERYLQTGKAFLGSAFCDLNRDGRIDIITGNSDGVLRVMNDSLRVIRERAFDRPITVWYAADFDANGTREIFLSTSDRRLLLLDENLNTLFDLKDFASQIVHCFLLKNKKSFNILAAGPFFNNERPYSIYQVEKKVKLTSVPVLFFIHTIIIGLLFISLVVSLYSGIRYKRRIHNLINESPFGIIILNNRNKITFLNHNTKKLISEDESKIYEFLQSKEVNEAMVSQDKSMTVDSEYNKRNLRIRIVSVAKEKIIIITDRTDEVYTKELFSWAGLAQRLAHEIKNPLSTINLTLQRMYQLCQEKFGKKAGIIDNYAKSVLEEVERLRKVTDRFMRVLSIEKPIFTHVDINSLINETVAKYEKTLPEEIKIKKSLTPNLPLIKCDENQISTALSNLIENAIESMEGKGVLNLRTSIIEKVEDEPIKIKRYVEIRIEDTGKGMSDEQIKNLFKPFYTTKKNGTGLGLVITQKIIEVHQGKIEISSKIGVGTIITVLLPVD